MNPSPDGPAGTVGILDLGLGNLASVARALQAVGLSVRVSADPAELDGLAGLIVPGVGAFAAALARLQAGGGAVLVREFLARGRPVLGICLGMQVMCAWGEEGGGAPGLGLVAARVRRLPPGRPVPHVGWNQVHWSDPLQLFCDLQPGTWFYFSHAYYVDVPPSLQNGDSARTAMAEYGVPVLAALEIPPLYGVQFHPEKSGAAGLRVLAAFGGRCVC
ncbi:MAG: imidazole glycerol phosphate synthase subunit HisH [Bacillota bacterium]